MAHAATLPGGFSPVFLIEVANLARTYFVADHCLGSGVLDAQTNRFLESGSGDGARRSARRHGSFAFGVMKRRRTQVLLPLDILNSAAQVQPKCSHC
jgi:hypothetical protein